jgi:hypothetical protein
MSYVNTVIHLPLLYSRYNTNDVCVTYSADAERYYHFTELACQLNEFEEGLAPTDSRHRPDQRLMEDGMWDDANTEKLRLEEKQRCVRRQRESEAEKAAAEGNTLNIQLFLSSLFYVLKI